MSEDKQEGSGLPPEVDEILDIATRPDGIHSALWALGGIQLVLTSNTRTVIKEFSWPTANEDRAKVMEVIAKKWAVAQETEELI